MTSIQRLQLALVGMSVLCWIAALCRLADHRVAGLVCIGLGVAGVLLAIGTIRLWPR